MKGDTLKRAYQASLELKNQTKRYSDFNLKISFCPMFTRQETTIRKESIFLRRKKHIL
jgi:hypothetical protein